MSTRFNLKYKRVFISNPSPLSSNSIIKLSKDDSHHWKKVLRAKVGQELEVVCKTTEKAFSAIIEKIEKEDVSVKILDEVEENRVKEAYQEILVAVPKNKALENLIEKAVELSVKKINLFAGEHSVNKLNKNKITRLEKIIEEAAKQSKQRFIAKLNLIENLEEFLKVNEDNYNFLVCSLNEDAKYINNMNLELLKNQMIIIGPEGDFSKNEYQVLKNFKCSYISLGNSVLKVDTAVISALSALKARTI